MVVFFIGCFSGINTGNGGHYYSLLNLAKEIPILYKIVVVGDFFPDVYKNKENVDFIKISVNEVKKFNPKKNLMSFEPSIIHAYDNNSAIFANKIAAEFKIPLVVTKPGGSALKVYSPVYKNMIVFHGEDFELLSKRLLTKPKKLALIANRVSVPSELAKNKRLNPFEGSSDDCIKILRISRIGKAYRDSIKQSIALLNRIQIKYGSDNVFLAIVGHVEDEAVLFEIEELVKDYKNIKLFVTPEYCIEAAELIQYSDVVIGTGRSFMEGMSYGKFVFFPLKGSDIPCFTTEKNYNISFYKNFSPRLSIHDGIDSEKALNVFFNYLDDKENSSFYKEWVIELFNKNHEVKIGASKLIDFYNDLTPETNVSFYKQNAWFRFEKIISFMRGKIKKLIDK